MDYQHPDMSHDAIIRRIKAHNPRLRKDADIRYTPIGMKAAAEVDTSKGNRDITVIANTPRIDEDSEIVLPSGAVPDSYFFENRSVFIDHMYDDLSFIGKVRNNFPVMDGERWKVRFGVRRSERGDQLLRDAEDFGVSVSIGFDALEAGPPTDEEIERYGKGRQFKSIVRRWNWAELSVTWMPCNVDARSPHPAAFAPKAKRVTLTPFGVIARAGA